MDDPRQDEFRRALRRIETHVKFVSGTVAMAVGFGVAWIVFRELPKQLGVSESLAGWVALGVFFVFGGFLRHWLAKFEDD